MTTLDPNTKQSIDSPGEAPGATLRGSKPFMGVLPFLGLILFVATAVPLILGHRTGGWQLQLTSNAVFYLIGWAALGAGISHILFGRQISRSIGFAPSPYELEVGFANLGFGIVGLMAPSYGTQFWLAIIVANSIFRVGCGLGHIRQMLKNRNFAINNTIILFNCFVIPAFFIYAYIAWAA